MSQLVMKIWALLALSGAIGVIVGWLIRSVGVRETHRALRKDAQKAQGEARAQRDEAARLAAKLQAETQSNTSQDVARLESEVRAAQAQADREAANANDLRTRLRALEDQIAAQALDQPAGAEPASPLGERGEVARLRIELARVRADQAAKSQSRAEERSAEQLALRAENAELRSEVDRLSQVEDEVRTLRADALNSQTDELQAKLDSAEQILEALSEADEAGYDQHAGANLPPWRHARLRWLEHEIEQFRSERQEHSDAPRPSATTTEEVLDPPPLGEDMRALLSRIADLERSLETARAAAPAPAVDVAGAPEVNDISRLTWRNQYLTSRVRYLEERAQLEAGERVEGEGLSDAAGEVVDGDLEVSRLRARVGDLERRNEELLQLKSDAPTEEVGEDGAEPAAWRNRYLTSRVSYLEGRVKELEEQGGGADTALHGEVERLTAALAGAQAQADEAARLRVRLAELDAKTPDDGSPAPGDERTLEWRNRYLTSRVRFLEERLALAEGGQAGDTPPPDDDASSAGEGEDASDEGVRTRA